MSKVKQNFAFGLTLNANHVSTAERDTIRGRYIKGWAEGERLNHGKSAGSDGDSSERVTTNRRRWPTSMSRSRLRRCFTSKDWKRMYSGGTVTN
ncbi:hypothetical protein ML401_38800 [Bradyrhizobium sp. 62B]|nr:hypothetical protein ML401_38800 [Bradyrhizobium sp. 62B]